VLHVTPASGHNPSPIDGFLKPKSVAIIGASRDPSKRGNRAIQTLISNGYKGKILPIHPKEKEVLGFQCYPDLASVPFDIDLAMICTPNPTVPDMIRRCGEKGVKGALILAGGFSEAGPEGAELEGKLVETAREANVRIIGPNTNGMFDAHSGMNLTGWPGIYPGGLGILSQSGNVALSLLAQSQHNRKAGLSTFVGVGNQSDIRLDEYLRFFADDENTKATIVYAEGFKDGKAFLDVAREVAPKKPVVLYKAGRTDEGEGAAKSHSGSLAGNYAVASAALKQAGVIQVERSDEMFPVAETLSRASGLPARRVVLLSEGGGPISQAADALAERGLVLPTLNADTVERLQAITPAATQLSNPVDAGGGTDPHPRYMPACAKEILADPNVDALLIVGYFGGYQIRYGEGIAEIENAAALQLVELARESGKIVMVQCHYADFETRAIDIMREGGITVIRSIEIAASCLSATQRFHVIATRGRGSEAAATRNSAEASAIVAAAKAENRDALLEPEAVKLLSLHGIEVPEIAVLESPDQASSLPASLSSVPVALKIVSKDILHKSDVGGVRLGVEGVSEIEKASASLLNHIARKCPDAALKGVLVAPMAQKGVEVIIGIVDDPQFGKVAMFGLGGIFVEVLKDVSFRALPLRREDALEMIAEIRGSSLLDGARGIPPIDRNRLADLILDVTRLAAAHPDIKEIDLNPVILTNDKYVIADARMVLA
jgi:acetate---CoA ligase (ADP-forming)